MTIWVVESPSERHVGLIWDMDFSEQEDEQWVSI